MAGYQEHLVNGNHNPRDFVSGFGPRYTFLGLAVDLRDFRPR